GFFCEKSISRMRPTEDAAEEAAFFTDGRAIQRRQPASKVFQVNDRPFARISIGWDNWGQCRSARRAGGLPVIVCSPLPSFRPPHEASRRERAVLGARSNAFHRFNSFHGGSGEANETIVPGRRVSRRDRELSRRRI